MTLHTKQDEDAFTEATNEAIALLLGLSLAKTGGENTRELKMQLSGSAARLMDLIQEIDD